MKNQRELFPKNHKNFCLQRQSLSQHQSNSVGVQVVVALVVVVVVGFGDVAV